MEHSKASSLGRLLYKKYVDDTFKTLKAMKVCKYAYRSGKCVYLRKAHELRTKPRSITASARTEHHACDAQTRNTRAGHAHYTNLA